MRISGIVFGALLLCLSYSCSSELQQHAASQPIFQKQELDAQVQIGYGLAIGDVDGDDKPDILLADKKQFVWYRNGDWKRFVMAQDLTEFDNVCIAARDIDGDGKVEVAVGAQWNPSNTIDDAQSGAVFYLIRPEDPTQLWEPVKLHHEPTVHRMQWYKADDKYFLIVLPLHGRGNQTATNVINGDPVRVIAYQVPDDAKANWPLTVIDQSMHYTHNFDIITKDRQEQLLIGGREAARLVSFSKGTWSTSVALPLPEGGKGFGEIRQSGTMVAGIQPMHGHELVLYQGGNRKLLTDSLMQGHALAAVDLLGQGRDQLVVGWRSPNKQGQVGIKLFIGDDADWNSWHSIWIDGLGMACEDLKVADLNDDGKPDIIASGRESKNLRVYWNRSE